MKNHLGRREFLRAMGIAAAGLLTAGCRSATPSPIVPVATRSAPTSSPTVPTATPTAPTASPTVPTATHAAPTASPTVPTATRVAPTASPTATQVAISSPRVAIAQAASYDRALVRRQVQAALDGLGGVGDVVGAGDRVAIKVNLTGGVASASSDVSATEVYLTHPEVVRVLGELLRDAGARELLIVEAVYDAESYPLWGYAEVARALGATLVDLNKPDPYSDFALAPVGAGWFIYENLTFNHVLEEVDAFVSVPKLKCHCSAGVTLAMKNLVGLVPARDYRLSQEDLYRSTFHGTERDARTRLPRVIADLNRARPIHLALIDGIKTAEGGEGPWNEALKPVQPGVLIAGKNALATDAVATAVMGFDPTADYPQAPFVMCDSHLNLAYNLGLGTNRLEEIEVAGAALDAVRYEFVPCWG